MQYIGLLDLYQKEKEKNKELEKIVEAYNVIPNDYIPQDLKIVIADREYFNNGILKETCIPKSKIKAKIEELREDIQYSANPLSIDNSKYVINVLQDLLNEEEE